MFLISGLCHNSLNQLPGEKYPTTFEDLQGFWDMVLLQVDHVDSLFKEVDSYRANNWKVIHIFSSVIIDDSYILYILLLLMIDIYMLYA